MAKEYLEQFRDSAEEQFAAGKFPIMALSAMNLNTNKIRFAPIAGEFNDGTNTIPEYAIQRFKRVKEADQQNANNKKAGSDYVATLDQAQTID